MGSRWCLLVAVLCLNGSLAQNSSTTYSREVPWKLSSMLLSMVPPFAPIHSNNTLCREHSKTYLQQLDNFEMWALKMFDANAKLPSGLLNGNINQLGDFDQCLRSQQPGGVIRGQYCLAYIEVKLRPGMSQGGMVSVLHNLVHSHNAFRSNLEDPGHRVPRFSSVNWAVCVPASCPPEEVEQALASTVDHFLSSPELIIRVRVDPSMCQVQSDSIIPPPASLMAIGFFLGIMGVIATATITDYLIQDKRHVTRAMEVLLAFSLLSNSRKLLSLSESPEDIHCVHGIRALNAFMLLMSHKSMALFFNPFVNRTAMAEVLGKPWTVIARAASLYTDPFIMISGLLTTYSLLRHLARKRSIDVRKEYLSRLLRLVPTLGALILFCTFVMPILGSGPQWNLVVRHHAEVCKTTWWRNLLFIHNYFGFKNMCLTHTHHIGIDTQLFAISPLLVWLLWRWPRQGLLSLFLLGSISTMLRFYTSYIRHLNLFVYFGNPVSQMFDTADYSYILPSHRFTVYAMGVSLGYGLWHWGTDFKLKTSQLTLGWFIAICMLYQSIVSPAKMGDRNYVYNRLDAANYAAFAPITWCLFFGWIIFTSHTGNGGFLSRVLSWKGFQVFTRISYSFYLTQFPVFFFNVGQTRTPEYYSITSLVNLKEVLVILISSALLTLTFEMPFINIKSIFFKRNSSPRIQSDAKKAD
ncbi:nose resistant to fluoxetine protein 6-like [Macrosteles quadrilineatus]|uniref:nose resistant to fluoxetine protein 6-like n=1 Tax=Macrosteles quadrilineatus TaxID=74068 RepID=UPI0023E2705D|nr:nose resistant to fluoxetine protein 6-like [Macrosteles quadrilineatus]